MRLKEISDGAQAHIELVEPRVEVGMNIAQTTNARLQTLISAPDLEHQVCQVSASVTSASPVPIVGASYQRTGDAIFTLRNRFP